MNYRHVYHAGNFADVLKHFMLSRVIVHLKQKAAPFRVIDTHAGAGLYDLHSEQAAKTGEWHEGIGRLLEAKIPAELAGLFAPLVEAVWRVNDGAHQRPITRYPGSPVIAAELVRPDDVIFANELHPDDRRALERALSPYRNARVLGLDGYVALKSLLPPKERRGVVLIDPPFEETGELQQLTQGLREGVRRFSTGTFLLWFPIKDPSSIAAFKRELAGLGLPKLLVVEFYVRAPDDVERLNGHGLAVLNPPYTLAPELVRVLPFLSSVLRQGYGARFAVDWLSK